MWREVNVPLTVNNKTYDGTTTGTGTVTLNGVLSGDTVGTAGTTFTFADKNAGTGKTVAVAGTTLTGADAGNYTVTVPASALADILARLLVIAAEDQRKTQGSEDPALTFQIGGDGLVAGDTLSGVLARELGEEAGSYAINQGTLSADDNYVIQFEGGDLLQGGSALVIEGNVARGIIFEVAPTDQVAGDNDEDKDGIEDAKEGNTRIVSYGSAAAVVIGAADRDITIGATEGTANQFGIILSGTVLGDGVYAGVSGTGMRIGGRGGNVSIGNGMLVNGNIGGAARNANATGLELGAGTNLPELRNSGTISATVSNTG